ncbi:unnamed protein product, partial [Chrysoparadoxa australica]
MNSDAEARRLAVVLAQSQRFQRATQLVVSRLERKRSDLLRDILRQWQHLAQAHHTAAATLLRACHGLANMTKADAWDRWAAAVNRSRKVKSGARRAEAALVRMSEKCLLRAWTKWQRHSRLVRELEREADVVLVKQNASVRLMGWLIVAAEKRAISRTWRVWDEQVKSQRSHGSRTAEGYRMLALALHQATSRLPSRRLATALRDWHSFTASLRLHNTASEQQLSRVREGLQLLQARVSATQRAWLVKGWIVWASASREAAVGEVQRHAGTRLVVRVLASAHQRALAKGWRAWLEAARVAAELELRSLEGTFYFAQVLVRVERRVTLRKMSRSWRLMMKVSQGYEVVSKLQHQTLELWAAAQRSGARALVTLASQADRAALSSAWKCWRRKVQEGREEGLLAQRRAAGCRVLRLALAGACRKGLAKAWRLWVEEVRTAAAAELKALEGVYYLAQ